MLYLCLFALLSLMSCSQDENMPSENGNKEFLVSVDFIVSGIANYGESSQPTTRAVSSVKKIIPLNEDFHAEVTLTPDAPLQTRSAEPTPMANGVRFRVLAYKENKYEGHLDYKIENGRAVMLSTEPMLLLNDTYKFIAYSYNVADLDLPEWSKTTVLQINAEESDFLYWTEEIALNSLSVKLPIVFSHLFPQFKVKLDTSELLGLHCNSANVTLKSLSDPLHKLGTWDFLTGELLGNNTGSFKPEITFSESELLKSNEFTIVSDPVLLFPTENTQLHLTLNANFGFWQYHPGASESFPSQVVNNEGLTIGKHSFDSNRSYTCLVKIRSTNLNERYISTLNNCILINYPITGTTNYYAFNVQYEGADSEDVLGTAVMGNGITPYKAVVLWQESDDVNSKIPLISGLRYLKEEQKLLAALNNFGMEGNALIALIDIDGTIIWSWHLWILQNYQYYDINIGTLNVGATSKNKEGLFFQYGRKDPLRKNTVPIDKYGSDSYYRFGVKNPTSFIKGWNWADNLWSGLKYKNNPCPWEHRLPSLTELKDRLKVDGSENGYINDAGKFINSEGGFWTNDKSKVYVPSRKESVPVNEASAYQIRCVK